MIRRPAWVPPYTQPWVIWGAIATHLIFGLCVLLDSRVLMLAVFVGLNRIADIGTPRGVFGATLIVAAFLAAIGLLNERRLGRFWSFIALMPQYLLLVLAFGSDLDIIISAEIGSRTDIPRLVLLAALCPFMVIAAAHTAAIYERYLRKQ